MAKAKKQEATKKVSVAEAEAETAVNAEAEAGVTGTTAPQLTVQDLVTLRSCIEIGSQRGAWRANELVQVGAVYEKLSAFLQSLLPPKEEAEETETKADTADKGEAND